MVSEELNCPKCHSSLVEPDNLDLICRRCGNKFTVQTPFIREISKYYFNSSREKDSSLNVISLESVGSVLVNLGFTVMMPASMVGEKSGIEHVFSLIARKDSEDRRYTVAVDYAVGDMEVGVSPLIHYTYKISDVRVDLPVFVAVPRLSEIAKRIAQGCNILVAEEVLQGKEQLAMLHNEIQTRLRESG